MNNERWLLPEGIEEVLPERAACLEGLRRQVLDLYHSWGYDLVVPPFLEYLDTLLTGTGHDLALQTFTLVDQVSGRMLGLRADMTPQVARMDAHTLGSEGPRRLCYLGTVLRARPESFGGTRSPLQVGAELYGHAGCESDAEILCLMLETLHATGLDEVHVDLGHVGIYRGLVSRAGLAPEQEKALFDALQRKARAEIEVLLGENAVAGNVAGMILALVELNGGEEVLGRAREVLSDAGADVSQALERLENVAASVGRMRPGTVLHFDLAELRGYQYHTGVVFAAYVPGRGSAIAQGGRYDAIGEVFGRARPATGFSADLKTLVSLGRPCRRRERGGILAPAVMDAELQAVISDLRTSGERVIHALPGQGEDADATGCDRILRKTGGAWQVVSV